MTEIRSKMPPSRPEAGAPAMKVAGRPVPSAYRWYVLGLLTLIYAFNYVDRLNSNIETWSVLQYS